MITIFYPDAFLREEFPQKLQILPFISYWGPVRQEMLTELNDNTLCLKKRAHL